MLISCELIVEDYPRGYPRLAAFVNSDNDFAIFRRFGTLYTRNLLQLQIELTEGEQKLKDLDNAEAMNPETSWKLHSHLRSGYNDAKAALLDEMRSKLREYGQYLILHTAENHSNHDIGDLLLQDIKLRKLQNPSEMMHKILFNWMFSNRPVVREDERFIFHRDDFVCLADHAQSNWFYDNLVSYAYRNKNGFLRVSAAKGLL